MSLRHSYRLIAPVYDLFVARALDRARRRSIARLPAAPAMDVLVAGVGTGLDFPLLPRGHRYVAFDLVPAMLRRALPRAAGTGTRFVRADGQRLPFPDASFDAILLHLIVAVVPDPVAALAEAARVARPGARLFVLDKFLREGEPAIVRRLLHPLASRIATRLDVVFERVLARVPGLRVVDDLPALGGGWFRQITLVRA